MYTGLPNYPYFQQPRTDIGQVNSEQEAVNAYVAAGASRIMFSADDKTVYVKCVSMNGQVTMDIFDRRDPQMAVNDRIRPREPASGYVTHEELTEALKVLKTPVEGERKGEAK